MHLPITEHSLDDTHTPDLILPECSHCKDKQVDVISSRQPLPSTPTPWFLATEWAPEFCQCLLVLISFLFFCVFCLFVFVKLTQGRRNFSWENASTRLAWRALNVCGLPAYRYVFPISLLRFFLPLPFPSFPAVDRRKCETVSWFLGIVISIEFLFSVGSAHAKMFIYIRVWDRITRN